MAKKCFFFKLSRQKFLDAHPVSSAGGWFVAPGVARKDLFDASLINQPVDCWLLRTGSNIPAGIIEVKVHFSRDEFAASPGNKYAAKLGLPLFVFLLDLRERKPLLRFGRLSEGDFFREDLRVDTVGAVRSMEQVVKILEEALAAGDGSQEEEDSTADCFSEEMKEPT